MFQCSYSYIYFTSVLWPEFTAWDFIFAIFMYQHNIRAFKQYKLPTKKTSLKAEEFIKNVRQKRLNNLYTIAWYYCYFFFIKVIYLNNNCT